MALPVGCSHLSFPPVSGIQLGRMALSPKALKDKHPSHPERRQEKGVRFGNDGGNTAPPFSRAPSAQMLVLEFESQANHPVGLRSSQKTIYIFSCFLCLERPDYFIFLKKIVTHLKCIIHVKSAFL